MDHSSNQSIHTSSSASPRKNPSRQTCEKAIRRILMTEVLQHGRNEHFRNASDFMSYFESLYFPSDSLTKQVQRAVKAMDMPKDERGYYIANKTTSQLEEDNALKSLLTEAGASTASSETMEVVFLKAAEHLKDYLIHSLSVSKTFEGKIITITKTYNGILIYTDNAKNLTALLNSLTI